MVQEEIKSAFPKPDPTLPWVPVPFFIQLEPFGLLLAPYMQRLFYPPLEGKPPDRTGINFYNYLRNMRDALDAYVEPLEKRSYLIKLRKVYKLHRGRERPSKVPPLYCWMPLEYAQEKKFPILPNPFNTQAHERRSNSRHKRLTSPVRGVRSLEDDAASVDEKEWSE